MLQLCFSFKTKEIKLSLSWNFYFFCTALLRAPKFPHSITFSGCHVSRLTRMGDVFLAGPSGVLWGNPRFTRDRAWGTFPLQTLSWEAQPRWTRLLWRPRGLQACVRQDFLKCHIHTSPHKHKLERLFFIYRLCRKQSPTELGYPI